MMKWYWTFSEDFNCKPHIIPEQLLDEVVKNLTDRGASNLHSEIASKTTFDLPGVIMVDRHLHDVEISNLRVKIPSTDIEDILDNIENLMPRNEIGKKYYKLHGYLRCICFTPELRNEFINALKEVLPEANAIALAENKEFNNRIRKMKTKTSRLLIKEKPVKGKVGKS